MHERGSQTERVGTAPGALLIAPGPRAAEARLLDELLAALAETAREPGLLARPLRVVVPSRSLRQHLCAAVVRRAGRGVAGLQVQTLRRVAEEILEGGGQEVPRGEGLLGLFVRRHARPEAGLRGPLESLQDGYAVLAESVSDLLDAGFEAAHADALVQRLAELPASPARERAAGIVRVAARTAADLERRGLGHGSLALRRARERLEHVGPAALPTRALWVHGFADATGLATDLIEALLLAFGGRALVEQPPDPAQPGRAEAEFGERFTARLARLLPAERVADPAPMRPVPLRLLRAPGATGEVRAVAARLRALLDRGVAPESVAVVARRLEPYRGVLRVELERLGIPCSAFGLRSVAGPSGLRVRALLELLERGERTPMDRVLDACAWAGARDPDLRLGLHVAGVARLADLAAPSAPDRLAAGDVRLPVRRGSAPRAGQTGADATAVRRSRQRFLPRNALARARRLADRLYACLRGWPGEADVARHRRVLDALLDALAWSRSDPSLAEVFAQLDALARELPAELVLERGEFFVAIERFLRRVGTQLLGGEGAGVALLSVTEARGRSFEHLVLLGLNRDLFPRTIAEDPLLPDALRASLATLLPDLPIKERGAAEERHLFAALLAASPHVTLSWQAVDDEGRERAASPFLERLRLARPELRPEEIPGSWEIPAPGSPAEVAPRPAHEHAVLAALHAGRETFAEILPLALAETRDELASPSDDAGLAALAASRRAVLDELDPPDVRRELPLGPYFGFVGPAPVARPGVPELYVTRLEGLARCPWQSFLRRELGLEPPPDALAALAALDSALVGGLVHRVLERIVREALPDHAPERPSLSEVLARSPQPVPWPAPEAFERWLLEEAEALVRARGIALPALARALADLARTPLEAARREDWRGAPLEVLGVEVEGALHVPDAAGRARLVGFRADQVAVRNGRLRITDYKTGRVASDASDPARRLRQLQRQMEQGRNLQAAAYLVGALELRAAGSPEGRFVFLGPDAAEDGRAFALTAEDESWRRVLLEVCASLFATLDAGAHFPRLVEAGGEQEPPACRWCDVGEACLRGDSAARRRLAAWTRRALDAGGAERDPLEQALLRTWALGREAGDASRGPS